MATIGGQFKQVLRRLRREPVFTAVTLLTLAAGIGANTAVFSVLESVLLKPMPYPHSEQLAAVRLTAPGINIKDFEMSPSDYFIFREQGTTFQDIGLYQTDAVSVTGTAEPERVDLLVVTDGVLPVLGIPPMLGREFTKADDSPGAPDTVVLTYGYWQRKFGGDQSVVGKSLTVNGKPHQIIGVMPRDFHFLDRSDPAIITPMQLERNKTHLGNFSFDGIARLKPGVTIAQLNADIARMLPIVIRSFDAPPGFSIKLFEDARIGPNAKPLRVEVVGDIGDVLWVLMGSIGMVLLIVCANVSNLMLVRIEGRRQELALRSALGAGWGRIAGELLFESLIIGMLSSALGLGLAYGALRLLVALAPAGIPRLQAIGVDGTVLLFTLGIAVLASVLFALMPVLKYAGAHLSTGIREGGRALSQSRQQHRTRNALVVVQVSLALVLLICSGLMIRTFRALTNVNPGFARPEQVQTFRIYIPETEVKEDERVVRFEQEIQEKIAAIPGVDSVAIGTKIPMDNQGWHDPVFVEGRTYAEGELPPLLQFKFMAPGFLKTVQIPLVMGRDFTWDDIYQKLPVAVISENVAREYWPTPGEALGKRIRVSSKDDWREIVGVTGNVYDDGVNQKPTKAAYWPLMMNNFESDSLSVRRGVAYAIRSPRSGSRALMDAVRQAVWSVDPNLPLAEVNTADYFYRRSLSRTSFALIMLGVAGGMALLLGVVGIYGVIAYSVSQRTREIGIRMALGAQLPMLTGMFVRQGMMLTGIGVLAGLLVSFGVMRLMSTLLFGVKAMDPVTYIGVSCGLAATAFLACYLPSRRAARVDPVDALRAE
ncbi:MAG TPA: ABC transporter permease [Methylomirabilota bacterium]|nr:ABC transporter permease [Methylomirabilota bacterium]